MKILKWYSFIIIISGLLASPSWAVDWPHYLGPNYDLKPLTKEFNAKSATVVWDAKVKTGMGSLTIANGLVYTMGNDGTKQDEDKTKARDFIYCLDAKTGGEKWTYNYPCLLVPNLHPGGPSSTPTIHDGKVYTISKLGHIFCLDARTGKKLWEASAVHYKPKKAWWGFAASPTIVGDVAIYNVGDRGLALNKDTGEIIWNSKKNVVGYATPIPLPDDMFGRQAVALFTNEDFLVLDPATGKSVATYNKTWQEKSNCNGITPYIHKGRIYLVHSKHGMARLSLDGNTFTQDWLSEDAKYPNEWFAFNTHVIYKDNIYFLTQKESGLSCVDAETGEQEWFDDTYDFGNLLRVGNKIIMLSEKGELIWGELDAAGFEETYRQKILEGLCWSKPILLGNLLYARSAEGAVVCLKLE
ncbi:MAG: PQQ-like beta-propeller repeat protein [Planctomycetes bacterium]|nr:PQQ-like beta-propeller repeat protein [Planctomycetota bacterium]